MILKHRDTEVLRFDLVEPEGVRVRSVNEAALRFLPLEMHGEPTGERRRRADFNVSEPGASRAGRSSVIREM